jgi:tRNA nucleotidyltransferase/poly(A) polymerase
VVRDAALGLPPKEVDLATTAVPDEVARRAAAAGIKAVPTGLAHGTLTLVTDGRSFEVTTLRRDVDTDGRHATVAFGRDWVGDARRRDFTINGLSLSRDGTVHDHVGGLDDLAAGRVRFIGDPAARIREDYLRVLRFFRFHAAFGRGAPDGAAVDAIVRERAGLTRLSRERVGAEMLKLMAAPGVVAMAELMADTGVFGILTGGVPRLARLARLVAIEAARGAPADALRRLGALALFVAEDAERLQDCLRLSGTETRRLAAMAEQWPQLSAGVAEADAKAALYRLGPVAFADRALLAWADAGAAADDPAWSAVVDLPGRWTAPRFPIGGRDLIGRGLHGPAVGAALMRLEDAWIAAGFPMDDNWRTAAIAAVAGE